MNPSSGASGNLLGLAIEARRSGRLAEARQLLENLLAEQPAHPVALNTLGLVLLDQGEVSAAIGRFEQAAAADPKAPPILLNLAQAHQAAGDTLRELASLDRALTLDPYLLPALLRKAQALERIGRLAESLIIYRHLLAATPEPGQLPVAVQAALDHGRRLILEEGERREAALAAPLQALFQAHEDEDLGRARAYLDVVAGRRKVYQQQPVDRHFPYLPAIEFFDRALFPWFEALEAKTEAIREELLSLWSEGNEGFSPYVRFQADQPVNQWAELNHSPRWSAWFLWKDGVRQDAHCLRCPETAAAVEKLPLLDQPGKAPTIMFSILEPRTRIPPHTGSSNVRTTIHLPLVVPEGCGFRVGAQSRPWEVGTAWGFDDTIEHEAWNDSDRPRAILILDCWNPLLSEAEKAAVRLVG